ncbi:MAG TPA: hypothetical protein VHX88_03215 [Solirubrobacteraceae bacterium]|nr:hypothetical protein [Solirubrobacteraceae bacterium]
MAYIADPVRAVADAWAASGAGAAVDIRSGLDAFAHTLSRTHDAAAAVLIGN